MKSILTDNDRPNLPLPEPIRGLDPDSFANFTLSERLPGIARRVLRENSWSEKSARKLEKLAAEMPHGSLTPMPDDRGPDIQDWNRYIKPYQGMSYLEAPWFTAETYFFRRIIEACGYYRNGPERGRDPYAGIKLEGMETVAGSLENLYKDLPDHLSSARGTQSDTLDKLIYLLGAIVWGNRADLSLFPAEKNEPGQMNTPGDGEERLLVDDRGIIGEYLISAAGKNTRIDIVLDNGGLELAYDLALADFLLDSGLCGVVHLHTKPHPTYVSDATTTDVLGMIDSLGLSGRPETLALAKRLCGYLETGALKIQSSYYWTSPLFGWQMEENLMKELSVADLLISKGDANYRRWIGDFHWPFETPIKDILGYLPVPIAFTRIFKSNCAAGLDPERVKTTQEIDQNWLYNGKWGVVQFFRPGVTSIK
ncbi:MAG: damage-control phosphatase ARMT1 family protein [Anaerolineales bacterium]